MENFAAVPAVEKELRTSEIFDDVSDSGPAYDPQNLETCKAFLDAKKKLRLVLSIADFHSMPNISNYIGNISFPSRGNGGERRESELVLLLKVQLAEAINLQDKGLIAQLHETIRCLRQFDNQE